MGFAAAPDALGGASGKDTSLGAVDAVLGPDSVTALFPKEFSPSVAGHPVPHLRLLPSRHPFTAHLLSVGTARAIDAAAGRIQGGWRFAPEHTRKASRLNIRIGNRHRLEEITGVRVEGSRVEPLGGCKLHHSTEIEHQNAIAKAPHDREVVTHEENTHAVLALEVVE
jgi:hypothetical protein